MNDCLQVSLDYGADEAQLAKEFYHNSKVQPFEYEKIMNYTKVITDAIASTKPNSVFEFGCCAGRNLAVLQEKVVKGTKLMGMDINPLAIEQGRGKYPFSLEVGDEDALCRYSDNFFDVSFTVSVLDHIPNIDNTVNQLMRITKAYLFIFEISNDSIGKVKSMRGKNNQPLPGYPFSYFHDYRHTFEKKGCFCLADISLPVGSENLLEFYRLYVFTKRPTLGNNLIQNIVLSELA